MSEEQSSNTPPESGADDFDVRQFAVEIKDQVGKLGRDLGKLRERVKKPQAEPAAGGEPKALTHEDLSAAMEAGRLSAGLPEAARARVDALVADGRYSEAKAMAEFALELGGSKEATAPKPPKAGGVSSAPTGPGAYPTTMRELVELQKTDAKAFRRLMADPNFDHGSLR